MTLYFHSMDKTKSVEWSLGMRPKQLTHGLVLGADGGGMVQNQDVSLELPAGQGVGARVDHHHTFPDLVPADLWE